MGQLRGQISTEVLILIGMVLLILLPLIFYAYQRSNVAAEDLAVQKAEFAAQRLARLADSVGYLGGAAAVADEIELPPYVKSVSVSGADIIFEMDSASGKKQIVKSSDFSIKAEGFEKMKKPGTYFVEVYALPEADYGKAQVGMRVR
ncbi:MAG: hypothetical protein N3E51_04050 [Candidatus Micrarchaeota archaeon]|nr:hypothetical protein [Candidatus Micrarchaeota archaeon]